MKVTTIIEIFSFAYLFIITCVYLSKKKAKSFENTFYIMILINNFTGLILEFAGNYLIVNMEGNEFLCNLINKVYLVSITYYILLVTGYIVYSLRERQDNISFSWRDKYVFAFNSVFSAIMVGMLHIDYHINNMSYGVEVYMTGSAIYAIIVFCAVTVVVSFIQVLTAPKESKRNAKVAWLSLFIGFIAICLIRAHHPGITVVYGVITLLDITMYFIAQSPDAKKVVELNKVKNAENEVNHNKLQFLQNMSHEIRTSLDTIDVLGNEVLNSIDEEHDDERGEAYDILVASDTLLDIVDNILDINKIESGELVLNNEDYNLKKEIESLVMMSIVRIENKPITFIMNVDQDIPNILCGDKVKVKQIINNLLTNAFKYTEKGTVTLNARCSNHDYKSDIIIEVKDTGIGIKDTSRLFTKFDRMDMDKTSNIEGTGLGLVITKQLVELMDGKLDVESTYGEGSKFTFSFTQDVGSELTEITDNGKYNFNLIGKKVLIVDDNILNLKASRKFFSKYNMKIDTCKSGREAINMVRSNDYDLVLLDIVMPDMDGIETLKNIKQIKFELKVIALTANAINGARDKYLKAGFDGYIEKPIDKKQVDKEFDILF